MKLSNETLTLLKNFATINSGIEFKEGQTIKTMSSGKSILAKATLPDSFPQDFCVYDLNQFLMVYNQLNDTEIDFDNFNIIFKSGRNKTNFRKTDKSMIVTPPDKELNLPSVDVSFTLTEQDLSDIMKMSSILKTPHISVESDGKTINLTAFNAKDDSAHTNSISVAEGDGTVYRATFLTENLKMIPGTYNVEICSKGLSSFKNTKVDIQYWIALESKESKFGE